MYEKHNVDLSFELTLAIFLVKTTLWKGNLILDTNIKLNISATYFPQIELVNYS
jgi:hypothetical protein